MYQRSYDLPPFWAVLSTDTSLGVEPRWTRAHASPDPRPRRGRTNLAAWPRVCASDRDASRGGAGTAEHGPPGPDGGEGVDLAAVRRIPRPPWRAEPRDRGQTPLGGGAARAWP